eukprot:TRINITY_DN5199_c0_g1_i2.p1 TRINITY_DN5199_c0_g1~~TRINITY_DN5199_c0_g1_i2.p1  ORF type:complete len:1510 (-),score=304.17 TRINITY_DN5199_c0_g1_i2:34-4155(-)
MFELSSNFTSTASIIAKVLILEKNMPVYMKSIKPSDVGGVAGGEKFISHGILFKYAEDKEIGDKWLYGKKKPSNYLASKSHNNDIKALKCINLYLNSCKEPLLNITLPLMTNINYLGTSITAISLLPLDNACLVYGTKNGGKDIFSGENNYELLDFVAHLAQHFGFVSHTVLDSQSVMHDMMLAADVEIHKSYNKYFMLDFGRFLPPNDPNCPFVHLFRSEYLLNKKEEGTPLNLSCDVFTGFGRYDGPDKDQHAKTVISEFESFIKNEFLELHCSKIISQNVKDILHTYGINLRYLGMLRSSSGTLVNCNGEYLSVIFLREMVLRAIKTLFRFYLAEEVEKSNEPSEYGYKKALSGLYNSLLNEKNPIWFTSDKKGLKHMILRKYGHESLTDAERGENNSLLDMLSLEKKDLVDFMEVDIPRVSGFTGGKSSIDTHIKMKTKDVYVQSILISKVQYLEQNKKIIPFSDCEMVIDAASLNNKWGWVYINIYMSEGEDCASTTSLVTINENFCKNYDSYGVGVTEILSSPFAKVILSSRYINIFRDSISLLIDKLSDALSGEEITFFDIQDGAYLLLRSLWINNSEFYYSGNQFVYEFSKLVIFLAKYGNDLKDKILDIVQYENFKIEYLYNTFLPVVMKSRYHYATLDMIFCVITRSLIVKSYDLPFYDFLNEFQPKREALYLFNSEIPVPLPERTEKLVICSNANILERLDLSNLSWLEINSRDFFLDVDLLKNSPLLSLVLKGVTVSSIAEITRFSLTNLSLDHTQELSVQDLEAISSISSLTDMRLSLCDSSISKSEGVPLSFFSDLPLRTISIEYTGNNIVPLEKTKGFELLEEASFKNINVEQLDILSETLKSMKLERCYNIFKYFDTMRGYRRHPVLSSLDLSYSDISSIALLPESTESLNLSYCSFSNPESLICLIKALKIRELHISGIQLTENWLRYFSEYSLKEVIMDESGINRVQIKDFAQNRYGIEQTQSVFKNVRATKIPISDRRIEYEEYLQKRKELIHPFIVQMHHVEIEKEDLIIFEDQCVPLSSLSELSQRDIHIILVHTLLGLDFLHKRNLDFGLVDKSDIHVTIEENRVKKAMIGPSFDFLNSKSSIEDCFLSFLEIGKSLLGKDIQLANAITPDLFFDSASDVYYGYLHKFMEHKKTRKMWIKNYRFQFEVSNLANVFENLLDIKLEDEDLPALFFIFRKNIDEEEIYDPVPVEIIGQISNRFGPIARTNEIKESFVEKVKELLDQEWFWGDTEGSKLTTKMLSMKKQTGDNYAVVRYSSSSSSENPFTFSFTTRKDGATYSKRIRYSNTRKLYTLEESDIAPGELVDMINAYMEKKNFRPLPGSPCSLMATGKSFYTRYSSYAKKKKHSSQSE